MLDRARELLRSLFQRRRREREMREEMTTHLEHATRRLMARGVSRTDAEREARREFGHLDNIEEAARDARGSRWIETTLADARFALRQFRRTPGATVTMMLVLALGIGANTAVFTVLHSMQTLPAPGIPRDDSLARIRAVNRDFMTFDEVEQYAALTQYFSAVVAEGTMGLPLGTGDGGLIPAVVVYVSGDYFNVLGVRPFIGRDLSPSKDGVFTAVLGHALWQSHFGGAHDVLGRAITVNGTPVTIVGVAPPRFAGADQNQPGFQGLSVWVPAKARATIEPEADPESMDGMPAGAIARLKPGVSRRNAEPAVKVVGRRAVVSSPTSHMGQRPTGVTVEMAPLLADNARRAFSSDRLIGSVMASVVAMLILLITCTNVSALLVGSAVGRRREIAVRLSLGAARPRVVRQLLTESVVLASGAGVIGVAILFAVLRAYGQRVPGVQLELAWPVIAFTFGFAIVTGVLFGLSPALHATRLSLSDVLKDAGPGISHARSRLQHGLIVAQIALTQPLLVGLGALIIVFVSDLNGRAISPVHDRIVTVRVIDRAGMTPIVIPTGSQLSYSAADKLRQEQWWNELERIRVRLRATPGVVGAVKYSGYRTGGPPQQVHPADRVPGARSGERIDVHGEPIFTGHLALMGIPLVRGRDFEDSRQDSASIIIGTDLAEHLWGDADPVGRRLQNTDGTENVTVIGVFDARAVGGTLGAGSANVFGSMAGNPRGYAVRLRTSGPAIDVIPALRKALLEAAPDVPVASIRTLSSERDEKRRAVMLGTSAAGAGGLLALLLSAIGLYSLIALSVKQRTREIGIRTALGASRGDVTAMFYKSGLQLSIIGLVLGLPLSMFALRMLEQISSDGPRATTPALGAIITLSVVCIASLATWIPARRAAAVNPMDALRDAASG